MQGAPYVSLSAQLTLERRLDLALNVANMNTVGYRAAGVSFSYLCFAGPAPTPSIMPPAGQGLM